MRKSLKKLTRGYTQTVHFD